MDGQYLLQLLGQLSRKNKQAVFAHDETDCIWHRETDVALLQQFCREGYPMARKYGHFIIGNSEENSYIGIPGRFLLAEQPAGGRTGFTLWQPLRGGEEMYDSLDAMPEKTAELIYGYWIAGIDAATLKIFEA